MTPYGLIVYARNNSSLNPIEILKNTNISLVTETDDDETVMSLVNDINNITHNDTYNLLEWIETFKRKKRIKFYRIIIEDFIFRDYKSTLILSAIINSDIHKSQKHYVLHKFTSSEHIDSHDKLTILRRVLDDDNEIIDLYLDVYPENNRSLLDYISKEDNFKRCILMKLVKENNIETYDNLCKVDYFKDVGCDGIKNKRFTSHCTLLEKISRFTYDAINSDNNVMIRYLFKKKK
jgi:adenylate kinase family enzyme